MTRRSLRPFLLFLPIVIGACRPEIPQNTRWTGEAFIAEGRTIPFVLEMNLTAVPATAAFVVGDERTIVPEVFVKGDSLHFVVSEYDAAFRLSWDGSRLTGRFERYRTDTTGFVLSASPSGESGLRDYKDPAMPLTGSFRSFYSSGQNTDSSTTAIFWARGDSIFGTLIAPSGDDGLFAGIQQGDTAKLSRFTAWQSIYLELVRQGTEWHGLRFIRELPPKTFVLRQRTDRIHDEVADARTRLRKSVSQFAFRGITQNGDTLDHLDDRFKGKPLIIDIMGTWCHNCLDVAPILQRLYEEYAPKGLEIVSLAFELKDDAEAGRRNIRIFRDRHRLTYTMLYCGDISQENVQDRIGSQLENFGAYPTAIFVDRSGAVIDIHKGFRGPGTGEGFQREIEIFYDRVGLITRQ